jgi:integrase
MSERNIMLVSDYVTNAIAEKPLKYSTRQSYIKGIKSLGLWDMDMSELSLPFFMERVEAHPNHNVRKMYFTLLRSLFADAGINVSKLPKLAGISKVYELPTQEELHSQIERSKYRLILYLCMYGGLRVGEACAVTPKQLEGDYLNVDRAFSQDGKHVGSPKTYGKVLLPHWLAEEVRNMKKEDYWQVGMKTILVTHACVGLSKNKLGIHINPHMLRHWFATDMIKRGINPEIVRRQLRHKNIETTMKVYVQVNALDLEASVPSLPTPTEKVANVLPFRLKSV